MKIRMVFTERRRRPWPPGEDQYVWVMYRGPICIGKYAAMVDDFWAGKPMPLVDL